MRGQKLTASWLLLVASLLETVSSGNLTFCTNDDTCIPIVDFDRCCGGECHPFEYCQMYYPQEWENMSIYMEHITPNCTNSSNCEQYADAKVYVRENQTVCCDNICKTYESCYRIPEEILFNLIMVFGPPSCILLLCLCAVCRCTLDSISCDSCQRRTTEKSAQGTAIGGDQQHIPAPSVNSHQPSPPSYTQALALPPLALSRAKIYVANRNKTKESPGYAFTNPGFQGYNHVGVTKGTSGLAVTAGASMAAKASCSGTGSK